MTFETTLEWDHTMKIRLLKLSIIPILILVMNGLAFGQLSSSQIMDLTTRSVVSITLFDEYGRRFSSGSGFFINAEGDIATNHHVLAGSEKALIETSEGKRGVIIEIIKDDPWVDLTIARTSIGNTTPLPLGDSDSIEVGEDVTILGDSPGARKTISFGIVKGVIWAKETKLIEITASIRPGRSGAPVLNSTGKVIGIATAFLDYGRKNHFIMPVNYLKTLNPTRLQLRSLPKTVVSFDAVLEDETFVGMQVNGIDRSEGHDVRNTSAPGTVYFKNGKRLVCERAWKDGNKVYLLVHKKKIAVGYDETEIDMERSFDLSTGGGGGH